eukprot:1437534-Rhodomonas_salina.2
MVCARPSTEIAYGVCTAERAEGEAEKRAREVEGAAEEEERRAAAEQALQQEVEEGREGGRKGLEERVRAAREMRCVPCWRSCLCVCYARSGTDVAYAATREGLRQQRQVLHSP